MEGDNVDDWKINLNLLLWCIFTTSLWDSYLNSCILKANGSCWFLEEAILLPKHNQFDFCFLTKNSSQVSMKHLRICHHTNGKTAFKVKPVQSKWKKLKSPLLEKIRF